MSKVKVLEKNFSSITLGDEHDVPSIQYTHKNLKDITPPMDSDPRRIRSAIVFPKDIARFPDMFRVHNLKIDSTCKGKDCFSCSHLSGSHTVSNVKLVILGDQHIPASVGAETRCIPVIRVEDGDFEAIKQVLWSQKNMGFKTVEGAVYAVALSSYLFRAGSELYWQGFDDLERWVRERMGGVLAPFIMPYAMLNDELLSKMQQCITVMRARFMGDLAAGRTVWHFSFWQPLYEFFSKCGANRRAIHVAPSKVRTPSGQMIAVESLQRAFSGVPGDFKTALPPDIEKAFMTLLLEHIEDKAPPTMLPIIPPSEWIEKGFERVGEKHAADPASSDKPTLYLYGNSTLREAGKFIDENELCKTHDLVMNCKGGDVMTILEEHPVPPLRHESDIVVLHFIGNLSLKYDKYGKPDEKWHYALPRILDDAAVNALIDQVIQTVTTVRKSFKGTIKVLGPLPRLLSECCDDPDHLLAPPYPFNASPHNPVVAYYAALNQFLVCHPKLAAVTAEIIPYQMIWLKHPDFDEKSLRDNIHLTEGANKIFADFIVALPKWRTKSYKLMELDSAFRTWAALFYGWGKKKAQLPDPSTATAAKQKQSILPLKQAPPPPNLPTTGGENMDVQSSGAAGASGSLTEFLENSAEEVAAAAAKNKKNAKKK